MRGDKLKGIIKSDLNETLKALAIELAFTDEGINKPVVDMVKDTANSVAKDLKNKYAAFVEVDIEDMQVACYIRTVTELLLNHLADFVEKQNNIKH